MIFVYVFSLSFLALDSPHDRFPSGGVFAETTKDGDFDLGPREGPTEVLILLDCLLYD